MGRKTRAKPSLRVRVAAFLGKAVLAVVLLSITLVVSLRWIDPPTTAVMVGDWLGRVVDGQSAPRIQHKWVDYDQIAPHFAVAVLAAEDQKFPQHMGFDLESLRDAVATRQQGGRLRGASTISQQLAKNLFLWHGRSFLRKGIEAYFTVLIELTWPKQRILETYMNVVELGDGIYGAEAASEAFFRCPAQNLSREQAALLAAVLPNPKRYRVDAPTQHVRQRQSWILRQMRNLGETAYLETL